MLTYAPDDKEPDGPMLARMPAFAMGDSVETYASTVLDCAYATPVMARREKRRM